MKTLELHSVDPGELDKLSEQEFVDKYLATIIEEPDGLFQKGRFLLEDGMLLTVKVKIQSSGETENGKAEGYIGLRRRVGLDASKVHQPPLEIVFPKFIELREFLKINGAVGTRETPATARRAKLGRPEIGVRVIHL